VDAGDAGLESVLKAVGKGGVFVKKVVLCEEAVPCLRVVWGESSILSVFEDSLELHDRVFHIQNIRGSDLPQKRCNQGGVANRSRWILHLD